MISLEKSLSYLLSWEVAETGGALMSRVTEALSFDNGYAKVLGWATALDEITDLSLFRDSVFVDESASK